VIRVSRSCISDAEIARVVKVLQKQYLGMGDEVRLFEESLSEFFGRPVACVVNGTAALQLAVQACDLGPGDEVLVPSLTYIASFQAISATGARPICCDVDPQTLVIDWRDAEKRVTSRTRAIMPVFYGGGVGDLPGIYAFAAAQKLRVIEDAAHAFGTKYEGRRIGGFGDISCFSFDGIKNITSGEGGCVVTDDPVVIQKVRDARLLGVVNDTEKRFSGQRSWTFDVTDQGWRYHMSDLMAAIGVEQLKRFPELARIRQELAQRYDFQLSGHPEIQLLPHDFRTEVPHIYVVRLRKAQRRDEIRARLAENGIQTGIHYQPNHWLRFYHRADALPLPVTERIFPSLITLPLHPALKVTEIEFICNTISRLLNEIPV
jgi:dTDP-4-amino-4,6-dideoxygalactose transaminase